MTSELGVREINDTAQIIVEGLNEDADYYPPDSVELARYLSVAIEYTPRLSYCLEGLEILVTHTEGVGIQELEVALCPDYEGRPSSLTLRKGTSVIGTDDKLTLEKRALSANWQRVDFKPVVVVQNWKYWIVINTGGTEFGRFALCTARYGKPTNIITRGKKGWRTEKMSSDWNCMLRFYGRILAVVLELHGEREGVSIPFK